MDFVRWATGTDAASMSHVGWPYRVLGAFLFVVWLLVTVAGSRGRGGRR